jgi:Raf kinase inhibitor-like YbhB/YbcL family protein
MSKKYIPSPMKLTSPAFSHNGLMPAKYTCEGENTSPALHIESIPAGTVSLALIMDDPDAPDPEAPQLVWEHWVVWNILPGANFPESGVPVGAIVGKNQRGNNFYGGPCPPIGTHRYFFKLYALDTKLSLPPSSMKKALEHAMQGHIIAMAELIGLYKKH